MDSVAEEVEKIINVEESYDDDDDVAKADRELARMKAKPIPAAKINTDKDKIKKTAKDKEEELDEGLKGAQSKLDVAEPKGKLTGADFKKLRKEDSEQIDELSVGKLDAYRKKAYKEYDKQYDKNPMKANLNRLLGAELADDKIKKKTGTFHPSMLQKLKHKLKGEEVEQIKEDEVLDERTLTSGESKEKEHYVKSMKKNVKGFKDRYGDRAKEVMYATATKMAKEEVDLLEDVLDFMQTEEYAQLDELSKKTLGNYVKKSTISAIKSFGLAGNAAQRSKSAADTKQFMKHTEKFAKRSAGIKKANARLNKEDVEQIDELSTKTLKSYQDKASNYLHQTSYRYNSNHPHAKELNDILDRNEKNTESGLDRAHKTIKDRENKNKNKKILGIGEETIKENYGDMPHAAKELVLHADNDHHLHYSSHQPIVKNLSKKMKKGTYHPEKAKKLWQYHADRAAQSYAKHHGDGTPWHKMFSVSDRKHAAAHWEDMHRHELNESAGPTSDYSLNSTFAPEASTPIARVKQAAHSAMKRIKDKLGVKSEAVMGSAGGTDEGGAPTITTDDLTGRTTGNKPNNFLKYKSKLKGDINTPFGKGTGKYD
jgi:hypothetical protein